MSWLYCPSSISVLSKILPLQNVNPKASIKPPAAPACSNLFLLLKESIFGCTATILVLFLNILIIGGIQELVTSISEFTSIKYLELIFFNPSLYPPANPRFFKSGTMHTSE